MIEESRRQNVPLPLACAFVQQESWGRNIFGCDHGNKWTNLPPYCQVMVTKDRVAQLIHNIENVPPIGQGENGVGYMQLTMLQLVKEANEMGGAWVPRYNIRRGLQLVRSLLDQYEYYGAIGAYNAGPARRYEVRWGYTKEVTTKHAAWKQRLV